MVIQSASKNLNNSLELKIDGVVLSQATHCKCLGITIDESLRWKQQVSSINSKILWALFAIKQLYFLFLKKVYLPYISHYFIHTLLMEFLHGVMLAQTSCVKLKPCTKEHSELYIIRVIIVTLIHSSSSLEF